MSEASKFHHPYEPYPIQQELMKVIYDCINDGKVGILESPTGTGKSLSLICASLTWLRDFQKRDLEAETLAEKDSSEPDWVLQHERNERREKITQKALEVEARLRAARAKELRLKQDFEQGKSFGKRIKAASTDKDDQKPDEAQFELADYASDEEQNSKLPDRARQPGLSSANLDLMRKLGLMPETVAGEDGLVSDEVKVFFTSRTHSQLSQLASELRRVHIPSPYSSSEAGAAEGGSMKPVLPAKHVPLGSRKNLCIHPKVANLTSAIAINERCLELQKPGTPSEQKCSFLPNKSNETLLHQFRDHTLAKIRDIEDLPLLGRKLGICPYYASRAAIKPCEVVTLPYQLLLQKSARDALDISLKGHVVIIDEAHNLMDTISNIHSTQVSQGQLKQGRQQLATYLQKFRNRLKGSNRVYVAQLMRLIDSISAYLEARSSTSHSDEGLADLQSVMSGKGVDQINMSKLVQYLHISKLARKVEGYASQEHRVQEQELSTHQKDTVPVLSQVQAFIETLAYPDSEGRFFYDRDEKGEMSLKYLLLDPSHQFKTVIEDARAVILIGGTMAPMDDYTNHLFPYLASERVKQFSCGHVIPKENLLVQQCSKGIVGFGPLDFTFERRNSPELIENLGRTLIALAGSIPDGLVVFFPSYAYLEQVAKSWKTNSTWQGLENSKPIFQETRAMSSVDEMLGAYSTAIASKRGGLMLAVIGGKLSEGINFSDALGRGVVVVGMPFPNIHSAQWKAKLAYIQQSIARKTGSVEEGKAASRAFVENACMRAVNQSVGRAIRHRNDYAAIVLLDRRFSQERIVSKLPAWIRQGMPSNNNSSPEKTVEELRSFFQNHKEN